MQKIAITVTEADRGLRLDRYLTKKVKDVSRSEIKRAILDGQVTINGRIVKQPSRLLRTEDQVLWEACFRPLLQPTRLDLSILHEDAEIVVVNKPAGLVIHPGAGHHSNTLVEGLLFDRTLPQGDDPVRPGIVHRLDKETSGLVIVAKTHTSLDSLKAQFAARDVVKIYIAQVEGKIAEEEGVIDAPIGRDPAHPRRMSIQPRGRPAKTEFHVLKRTEETSLLYVRPYTGRTHQIRVHLRYIHHPVVGDKVYGRCGERLMLHAWRLVFTHPGTGKMMRFEAAVPPEFPAYPYHEIPWCAGPQIDNPGQQSN